MSFAWRSVWSASKSGETTPLAQQESDMPSYDDALVSLVAVGDCDRDRSPSSPAPCFRLDERRELSRGG